MSTLFINSDDFLEITQGQFQEFIKGEGSISSNQGTSISFASNFASTDQLQVVIKKTSGFSEYQVYAQNTLILDSFSTEDSFVFDSLPPAAEFLSTLEIRYNNITNDNFSSLEIELSRSLNEETAEIVILYHPFVTASPTQRLPWGTNQVNRLEILDSVAELSDEYTVRLEYFHATQGEFRLAHGLTFDSGTNGDYKFIQFSGSTTDSVFLEKISSIEWLPYFNFEGTQMGPRFYITISNDTRDYIAITNRQFILDEPTITPFITDPQPERVLNEDEIYEF